MEKLIGEHHPPFPFHHHFAQFFSKMKRKTVNFFISAPYLLKKCNKFHQKFPCRNGIQIFVIRLFFAGEEANGVTPKTDDLIS